MVGGLALREALQRPDVARVTSIGRRPSGIRDPKLTEAEHRDFTRFDNASPEALAAFENQDAALFCLGVYTGAVPDDEFRRLTVDTAVAFAETLHERSPEAAFCLLSGQGADPKETSRIAFARYKGMAENALLRLGFPRVHIFRPGYIYPVETRDEPNLSYRIFRAVYPALRIVYPNVGLPSDDLARAMVHAGLHGTDKHAEPVLENRDIRELAKEVEAV